MSTIAQTASRLSEHFHKVRLTSLLLSSILFLLAIRSANSGDIEFLGIKIGRAEASFVLVAIAIAAIASFLHAWVIWYSETRDLDLQIRRSSQIVHQIYQIIDGYQNTQQLISETATRVEGIICQAQEATPTLKFKDAIEAFEQLPSNHLDQQITQDISMGISSTYFGLDNLRNNAPSEISRSVISALQEIGILSSRGMSDEPVLQYTNAINSSISAALNKQIDIIFLMPIDYQQKLRDVISANMERHANVIKPRALDWLRINEEESDRRFKIVEAAGKQAIQALEMIKPPLAKSAQEISYVLRPLKAVTAATKIQLYGFDIWAPAGLFMLAVCHAVGRLFGGFLWSAPETTERLIKLLAPAREWGGIGVVIIMVVVIFGGYKYAKRLPLSTS